jgi:hypothetical protein
MWTTIALDFLAMDVDELMLKAWTAVEKAGIPDNLCELALKEAIDFLRAGDKTGAGLPGHSNPAAPAKDGVSLAAESDQPQEADFFAILARESGASEDDLRDILILTSDGKVQVTPPTRSLGATKAQQARTVVALVAGARTKGLGEKPGNLEAVRAELTRKQVYDRGNFSSQLGRMKGFNRGSTSDEILPTSKWLDDFTTAVATAHGRRPTE